MQNEKKLDRAVQEALQPESMRWLVRRYNASELQRELERFKNGELTVVGRMIYRVLQAYKQYLNEGKWP